MKCPKCGYLGFETTDRCRNCQYDFSLAPFASEPDLRLQQDELPDSKIDFDLPSPNDKSIDARLTPGPLDLDRVFGDTPSPGAVAKRLSEIPEEDSQPAPGIDAFEREMTAAQPAAPPVSFAEEGAATEDASQPESGGETEVDPDALPFEELPLVPPRAARAPLAVRRSTADVPRNRTRTTRPLFKSQAALSLELGSKPDPGGETSEGVASSMETPSLATRVSAGLIDSFLLFAISAAVLVLTLRIAGLQTTFEDARVLPLIPFGGFLAMLAFGYVASFTVAGGQTIGKMLFKLRVIGDDGRAVDAAGGMLRALGCMLVPAHSWTVVRARAAVERPSRPSRSTRRHARGSRMKLALAVATFGYVGSSRSLLGQPDRSRLWPCSYQCDPSACPRSSLPSSRWCWLPASGRVAVPKSR